MQEIRISLAPQHKKILSAIIKGCILLLIVWFVYKKLNDNQNLLEFNLLLAKLEPDVIVITIGILLALMLINWLLECVKWQYLCKPIEHISFWKAVESVFCGLSWAIFTPNRIGEYGGRVFFLQPRKRIFGVVAMAVGAFAQMIITNIVGVWAFLWFVSKYWDIPLLIYLGGYVLAFLFSLVLLLMYFRISLLHGFIKKYRIFAKVQRFFSLLARYKTKKLARVFALSFARFVVFTSQYVFIMQVLIADMPIFAMVMMVFILFFIQSAIPSLDLLDVGVRSLTAGYLFAYITTQELAVMASAAAIWFVNLIIPAIIGSVFVFKINFFGNR
ncbi:flippase-like domain-containing protein [Olivibacter sp. SDN3]|uniref:lysylphosphatidylglycerol synthase domain-containing protein n=1 Tax=Olivibacter sp. SDN3 TaxID=2764720 RepID=UPI0016516735|nr:lysylphosphatidylglycerol synthase domain-containing protein [Olivibacter sp. SDN3]QNL51368.1 flippase-like domain-containing protein [Olivibacter sp. SDN3]